MKYLKFYVDTEDIEKRIIESEKVKDIRFISSNIDIDGKVVEVTCLVESENDDIGRDNTDCYRHKVLNDKELPV